MLKLKKAKIQEEEIAKKRERDNFNNQCDYLNQLATVNKKHQQELIHSHHELLKNEWKKNNDQKVMNKESELQQHQKFLDYVEFQKLAESNQKNKHKENLKLLHQNYYDTFMNKKKQEEIKKQEDAKIELENRRIRNLDQEKREKEYRDRLEKTNRRIFENGQKQIHYLERVESPTGTASNENFNVSNDIDFNLRRVKKHEQEQNLYKIQEQNMLSDRLKNLDELNNYTKQSKLDKLEEQKRYREILDSQVEKNIAEGKKQRFVYNTNNELILPSYNHPNRAAPNIHKAVDHVHRLKLSYDFKDKNSNINLESIMPSNNSAKNTDHLINSYNANSNPMSLPFSDFRYNKYIDREFNKLKQVYDNSLVK